MITVFKIGFLDVKWVDFIDILLVTILLSQVYKLMRGTIAIRVFLGFLSLYLIYLVVRAAEMELLTAILGQFMGVGVLALIILFQQEIRKFLILLGRTTAFQEGTLVKNMRSAMWSRDSPQTDISSLVDALKTLSASSTGALVVLSKESELRFYAESGDIINAELSKRLLMAIFNKHSPMHDGAVIIYRGRIVAARCILPVTDRDDIPANFGLRHRAAIGMSETTNVLVVIVSEESGQMNVAQNGKVRANLSAQELRSEIKLYLSEPKNQDPSFVRRLLFKNQKASV